MRRLAGVVVGIVLSITGAGRAGAQRRIRLEQLGSFELLESLVDEDGEVSLSVGGAVGSTRAGANANEALAGARYAARGGVDYVTLDSRLTAVSGGEGDPLLDGSHRGLARMGNVKLDVAIDHSAFGRSFSLKSDVRPVAYRDVAAGGGVDMILSKDRDRAIVAPVAVRARRVTYQDAQPGLSSIEISAGIGTRFDGERAGEHKGGFGTAEMFGLSYIGTRIEGSSPPPGVTTRSVPPDMSGAAGGQMIHEVDFRLINFDKMLFYDGPFAFTMYVRMGYGYLENQTTGDDGGVPMFTYGMHMGDDTGGLGLAYSTSPATTADGDIVSVWRVEMLARGRRKRVGAWDARFGWTCASPEDTDDVCGEGAVGRAAVEVEGYLELSRALQVGASYLGDYSPWRGRSEWRNEALAFLRWDVSR